MQEYCRIARLFDKSQVIICIPKPILPYGECTNGLLFYCKHCYFVVIYSNKSVTAHTIFNRLMEEFMLKLENIYYSVGGVDIINGITIEIDERFVAITGPNGSGKSTLAKIIAGIITPTSGKIYLDGEDITDMSITDRANRGISFAFQQPVRFKGITVKDLISLASGKKLSITEACQYLSEVGLCARDYINREVNASLSGGELKRIEIAMINARGTKLSVFDEPEAGIDLWSFQNLIKVFEKMYERNKGSILIISHQERILDIADKILVLKGGKIDKIGTKDEIMPTLLGVETGCRYVKEDK